MWISFLLFVNVNFIFTIKDGRSFSLVFLRLSMLDFELRAVLQKIVRVQNNYRILQYLCIHVRVPSSEFLLPVSKFWYLYSSGIVVCTYCTAMCFLHIFDVSSKSLIGKYVQYFTCICILQNSNQGIKYCILFRFNILTI